MSFAYHRLEEGCVTSQTLFDDYTSLSLNIAVDLANTLLPMTGGDTLEREEDLRDFLRAHDEAVSAADEPAARWHVNAAQVRETRELRDTLRVIFEFAATEPARAVAALDAGLIASGAMPRMSHRDGWPYRYFTSTRLDCASWLAATTLTGMAAMLSEYGGRRLGTCTADSCRAVYLDLSKNTSKVYCSQTCAHRQSVAAFRARRRADRQPAQPDTR
jgi:predicted RNA-binding Zn ribbon-like protein